MLFGEMVNLHIYRRVAHWLAKKLIDFSHDQDKKPNSYELMNLLIMSEAERVDSAAH
jgi:hypothetical protein